MCEDHVPDSSRADRDKVGRKRTTSKEETARRRREQWEKTCREIDEITAEYHALLPREQALAIAIAYLRYSTRFQDSIADQLREILKNAVQRGIFVPRELIFFDLAVRGCTNSREGLNAMREAIQRKEAQALLLFSTSRLFRKQYRTLAFVDEVHRDLGLRCIFVKSGVDTDDRQRWESILAVQSMVDQFVVTMNVANIQAAHQGQLEKRIVFGTLSFGFTGEPLPGEFTKRKKPRCRIILDAATAPIVLQIFQWYVEDRLTIAEIIRRLNHDDAIPLPPRSGGEWTRQAVKGILQNSRYRGLWKYGICESVFLPAQDYTRQRPRPEPLKELQIEELRVVPDALWFAAQVRLAQEPGHGGRKPKDEAKVPRPKLLNGLLVCHEHQRALYVGGPYGRAMICPCCQRLPAAERPLFTQLNRQLAMKLVCERLAELVRADESLVQEIVAACQLETELAQKPDPVQLARLKADSDRLARKIAFTRRTAGDTAEDETVAEAEIKQLQAQRKQVTAQLEHLEALLQCQPRMPSEVEIRETLGHFHEILAAAARGETGDADTASAREIIRLLTGGRIELVQMGERKAYHGWLQGRFAVGLLSDLVRQLTGVPASCASDTLEILIDFKRTASLEEDAERAWQLKQQDCLHQEIAYELECGKSYVTKLLKHAAQRHGETYEDGRSRRSRLAKKHLEPPLYQRLAEDAMRMFGENMLYGQIATELGVDRNTVTAIIRWWHVSRGMPVPDGRSRRKSLPRKPVPPDSPADDTQAA